MDYGGMGMIVFSTSTTIDPKPADQDQGGSRLVGTGWSTFPESRVTDKLGCTLGNSFCFNTSWETCSRFLEEKKIDLRFFLFWKYFAREI
jgi:hypothetical protein